MNLRFLTDDTLLLDTKNLVVQERELLIAVLYHLKEIEARRLFSSLGFKSLFDYAVKELGYSEDQAGRRISAMRLLKEIPEVATQLESGVLTLTNIGFAQKLFRREKMKIEEKREVLQSLESKSAREAERIVLSKSSNAILMKPDQVKEVSDAVLEFKFNANRVLGAKLERVRGLLAHTSTNISLGELIVELCDIAIETLSPRKPKHPPATPQKQSVKRVSRASRRNVWNSADGKCVNCGSRHALQVDHIRARALGGSHTDENLRLLCRNCNQREAIKQFGVEKMNKHFVRADS